MSLNITERNIQFIAGSFSNCNDAFKPMSEFISEVTKVNSKLIIDGFKARESESNTAIGDEVAIPHAILNGIEKSYVFLHLFEDGVDWNAYDQQKVKIVFSLVVAKDLHNDDHLRHLSSIAMSLMDEEYRMQLKTERDLNKLVYIINEMGGKL